MTASEVELTIQKLLAGEERSYDGVFGGDPWSGYTRLISYYGYDSERATFYTYEVEEISTVGYTSPSNQRDISLQELETLLLKERYP